jgi:fructokinase
MQNSKPIICFGEVLWDVFDTFKVPGGAPMNVAIGLQNLGIGSYIVSSVGADSLGEAIKEFLITKNCSTIYLQEQLTLPTGMVKVTTNALGNNSYEIVQPAAWDNILVEESLKTKLQNAYGLVYGTLSCRRPENETYLLELLALSTLNICDINFRTPFYNKALFEKLMAFTHIVKMNDEELAIIAKWFKLENCTLEEQVEKLYEQFKFKLLIVTKGANGAMVKNQTGIYYSKSYKVAVVNTVGCGDAFLAAFLKAIINNEPIQEALNYAAAIGAWVATHNSANPNFNEQEIEAILRQPNAN